MECSSVFGIPKITNTSEFIRHFNSNTISNIIEHRCQFKLIACWTLEESIALIRGDKVIHILFVFFTEIRSEAGRIRARKKVEPTSLYFRYYKICEFDHEMKNLRRTHANNADWRFSRSKRECLL